MFIYDKFVLGVTRIYFNKEFFYQKGNNVMFAKKEVDENYVDIEILNVSNKEIIFLIFKGL